VTAVNSIAAQLQRVIVLAAAACLALHCATICSLSFYHFARPQVPCEFAYADAQTSARIEKSVRGTKIGDSISRHHASLQ